MSRQIQIRRGTTAENDAFTGAEGEITCDTQTHELRVHDGSTQGGHTISLKNNFYLKSEIDTFTAPMANKDLNNLTNAGKTVCANMAMPSNTVATITIGASGASYTAPADGYVALYPVFGAGGWATIVYTVGAGYFGTTVDYKNQSYAPFFIPVRKGVSYSINYNNVNSWASALFVYAQGAQ